MKFDGGFKNYLFSGKGGVIAAALALLGLLLLLWGGGAEEGDGGADTGLEGQLAELCSSAEGVGECRVMVTYGEDGEVYAVAVLCEGAGSDSVRARIKELVGSLFGIGSNRISVVKIQE